MSIRDATAHTTPPVGPLIAAGSVAAFAALLTAVVLTAGTGGPEPQHASEPVGLAIPFTGVALTVAVAAFLNRPGVLIASGVGLLPMTFVSFSGLGLPLIIPAIYLIVAGFRLLTDAPWRELALIPVVGILLPASLFALFATDDPTYWTAAGGSGSSSDHIAWHEAGLSLALATTAVVVVVAVPRRH